MPMIRRQGMFPILSKWLMLVVLLGMGLPGWLPAQVLEHRYSFTTDATDSVGGANGTLVGNAYISDGYLVLPGGGTSANPQGYVSLPNGMVTNDTSITVECWLTDNAGLDWAEAWCFGDSAAGAGQTPTYGTAYISLIPHSGDNDFRAAFNLTGGDEVDVVDPAGPLPLNTLEYAVVTYDATTATAQLYLNGVQVGTANVPVNLAPSNYGNTFNDWIGRDEFGGDSMFNGTIHELRIWNGVVSSNYVALSAQAGPDVIVTNPAPTSISVQVTSTNLIGAGTEQAAVYANYSQVPSVLVTSAVTNWSSSDPNVITVSSSGLISAVSLGSATVSATYEGLTATSAVVTVSPIQTVGYWQFNNSTNLYADSSGLGNTLSTANGNPVYSTNGLFGGGALYLDGNSTLTTASGGFPVYFPVGVSPYTIAVWEKVDAGCPNTGGLIGWGQNDTSEANNLRLNGPNGVDDYWYNNDFVITGTPDNPMDGNWHSIIVTWDGTTQIMYVDGQNVGSRTPSGLNVQAANFVIGATTADVDFKGWMNDLLVLNIPMTTADIAIYQAGDWSANLPAYPEQPVASPTNAVYAGTTVTLTALAAGVMPFVYQWQDDGTDVPGATNATLVLSDAVVADSGSYAVVVGNQYGTNISPVLPVTIFPASPPVFTEQPSPAFVTNYVGGMVTLAANVDGTKPIQLQWQHNGVNIPNANSGTLTLAALQSAQAGDYTLMASNSLGVTNSAAAVLTVLPIPNPSAMNMLTYHNDNYRDGADTNEYLLTPNNVNVATFGRLITYPTDGLIIAQPLYMAGLNIPGQGVHNVVFVATENNTIYAFDADSNAGTNGGILWQTNLGPPVSSYDNLFGNRGTGSYYPDITPVVGITGTPVIDPISGTLYVSVHTATISGSTTTFYHNIHAINITNGTEEAYSPMLVTNALPGTGVDGSNGIVPFDPRTENQRPGLALAGGMVYVAYGSYADTDPYHGWILGFSATNLTQSAKYAFNTTPNATVAAFGVNAGEGALWMSGNGICVDASNNLFFATANGSFSQNTNGGDYGDSFVKLSTTNGLGVADYFTPYNAAELAANDTDLGSGGTILLPDAVGSTAHPHLIIGCGKDGILRLVDRDNMGHFNAANDSQIVQEVPGGITGAWSTPAYFNSHIYYQGSGDVMRSFLITNATIVPTPTSVSLTSFNALGGTPVISANGTNNGIAWAIQSDAAGSGGPAVLHAYNATNLSQELYNSSQNVARDSAGPAIIMTTPTVAGGKVFVGAQYALSIYGNSLFLATPVISPAGGTFTNNIAVTITDAVPNCTIYYTLDGTVPTTNSLIYTGPLVLSSSASLHAMATQAGAANSGVVAASFVDTSATGAGVGLLGDYWTNLTATAFTNLSFNLAPTLVRTDAVVNFNWASTPPAPSVGSTNFVVRWTGALQPEYSETYTFTVSAVGGVRLFVNGQLLINQWGNQTAGVWSNSISLTAQQLYNVEMDYYNPTGGAAAQLYWSSPSTANAIIPQTQLYPFTNPPPSIVWLAPANSSNYTASASVTMSADADAPYNPISAVSFFVGNTYIGSVSNEPYSITATGLVAGNYALTAVATDGSGLSSTSAPISITVKSGSGAAYGMTNRSTVPAFFNMPTTYSGTLPPLLSETGVYTNTPERDPAPGLISYVPNTPLWSDNAVKSRYMGIPNNGGPITAAGQIGFLPTNSWSFPAGTVFVKNFDMVVNQTNANAPLRRLETRLLVRDINGAVYGVTYKWRPDNSDADLLTTSSNEVLQITNSTGVTTQTWYYPSPSDCLTCHTPVANYVLGISTRQLNGSLTYPASGVTDNQLRTLNRLGLFNPAFDEASIANFEYLSAVTNMSVSPQQRARSYLDANCAQCHQPGGTGITFDARYDTPLAKQNITNYPAAFSLGIDRACIIKDQDAWRSVLLARMNTNLATIKMPPLARNLIDTNAVQAFIDWINSLPGTPALAPPTITPDGGSYVGSTTVSLSSPNTNAAIYYTLDGTLPTTNSLLYAGPFALRNTATISASAFESNYDNSAAEDALFLVQPLGFTAEQFLPNQQFQMVFSGTVGSNYVLEASTNLVTWMPVSTNVALTNIFNLVDTNAVSYPYRFYRVKEQ